MSSRLRIHQVSTSRIEDAALKKLPGRWVVWWYGPITKNTKAVSVPKIVVFLRKIDDDGNLGEFMRVETALTHLGLLRIGSVWKDGARIGILEYPRSTFDVSFSEGGWKLLSPYDTVHRESQQNPIPAADYPLPYASDRNQLLAFSLPGGKTLLIPCMEFFTRCYGRSAEVKRVLATYRWEEAHQRLFKPIDVPASPGTWLVKLARRLYNDDAVFLAHVFYDNHARQAAKSIYAQIEAAFQSNHPYAFIKVTPWFRGSAQLLVEGIPINNGRTYLGLRILGCSDPRGDTILRDRENTNKKDDAEAEARNDSSGAGIPVKALNRLPDIVNLTEDDEPDHGASTVEIEDDAFVVLGEPRSVIDVRRAKDGAPRARVVSGADSTFSSGEPYGSGKGVGNASIHTPLALESRGVLRDMWNAALYLRSDLPKVIERVEWFTFKDGFVEGGEPNLIALEPFGENDGVGADVRKWVFRDPIALIPRGVLVMRITVQGRPIFIFEMERRPVTRKGEDGESVEAEEAFKGLVFVLNDQQDLSSWLRKLLSDIRYVKGVVQRVTAGCPGRACAFKHASASDERVPCEAAVRNALRKAGVEI